MANTIRAIVLGFEHSKGLSKANDRPYDYAVVNYLGQNDGWTQSQKGTCTRVGLMQKTIAMRNDNPSLFAEFSKLEGKYPIELELELGLNPNDLQKNWVVDFKIVTK